jgi:hypothetical protein
MTRPKSESGTGWMSDAAGLDRDIGDARVATRR